MNYMVYRVTHRRSWTWLVGAVAGYLAVGGVVGWGEVFGRHERASKADCRSSGLEGVDLSLEGEAWMKAISLTPAVITALRSAGLEVGWI